MLCQAVGARTRSLITAIAFSACGLLSLPSPSWAACEAPVARIVAVDNAVSVKAAGASTFVAARLDAPVCQGDSIRVEELSRTTIAFVGSGLRLTIEQNTEFVVRAPPQPGRRSLIQLLRGAILFFTRQPRSLDVETPFVNAAVEGTEFLVRVSENRADVSVLEGVVALANTRGTLVLTSGQSARTQAGEAPRRIDIRPHDAVRWALYYDTVVPRGSLTELDAVPDSARDAAFHVRRANALLAAGRIDEARADVERALAEDARSSDAHALAAVMALARNERDAAVDAARRAVSLAPDSVAARLALSYALQAGFDLESARDELLRVVPSDRSADRREHATALARLAELWLSLGYVGKASAAAARAVAAAPDSSRAHTVVGFTELTRGRTAAARAAFGRAIAAESTSPLAHLGLGLARIREGDLQAGRADIETAAALDADDAVIRSYLGKAYFEEKRDTASAAQFTQAKELDPRDPTPWLYDALRKQTINRPIEALQDLQTSIALNDNRAVYRSRLLLDADLAARGAGLGRVYRDLGFEQLALVEGWKSLAVDPANHSAHRLLADAYLGLPRHTIARDSELLQSQLLQPLNVSPVQPRLADNGFAFLDTGMAGVAFNEFTRLFTSNQLRLLADGVAGSDGTFADNLIFSGVYDRVSFSVGQFHTETDGIRDNDDASDDIYNAFVQAQLAPSTSVQVEVRATDGSSGDRRHLFDPDNFLRGLRSIGDDASIRLGGRHAFRPESQLIGSYVHRTLDSDFDTGLGLRVVTAEDADFGEFRYLHTWNTVNATAGIGYYAGDRLETVSFGPFESPPTPADVRHSNAYVYADVIASARLTVTGGLSRDDFNDGVVDRTQVNPKLGVTWVVDPATTVRAAAFRAFERTLIAGQTVEPTHVAGFNQFFYDANATDSRRYGLALDRRLGGAVAAGVEGSVRRLHVPTFDVSGALVDSERRERLVRLYLHATPANWLAFTSQYRFERLTRDPEGNNEGLLARSTTNWLSVEGRLFVPSGAFGRVGVSFVDQDGQFQNAAQIVASGSDRFWTFDASLGYRLPRRLGVAVVELRNLFDNEFRFQDISPGEPTILATRQVIARVTLAF